MKLLLRRTQKSGMMGKVTFTLEVRADISAEEKSNIAKYKLGETILYASHDFIEGSGLLGAASKLAFKALTISVTVNDLANGKRIDCKDIVEMLDVENQLKEAAYTFKNILHAATHFGGDEIIEL